MNKVTLAEFSKTLSPGTCNIEIYEWNLYGSPKLLISIPAYVNMWINRYARAYLNYYFFEIRVEKNLIKLYITKEIL